jgi:transposase
MTKYTLETKLGVVQDYLEGKDSYKGVARKHRVTESMVAKWVKRFRHHGLEGLQKQYTNHSLEFKMDVLNYLERTGASIKETALVFNIPSDSTVWKWRELFEAGGLDALQPKAKGRTSMKKKESKNQPIPGSVEALRAENELLRAENAYLKKLQALIQEKETLQTKIKRK